MALISDRFNRFLLVCTSVSAFVAAACGDDSTPPEPEPEVTTIRITVGASTIDVPHPTPCTGTNTPVPLVVNQANQVSFRMLGANGQDEPIIVAERASLELRITNTTGWTVTPTGGSGATFTATITPTATGSFIPLLEVENIEHGHNEVECVIRMNVS